MSQLPSDLVLLPTTPYAERPQDLPLDVEECRTALWLCNGNVSSAADMLKVTSSRLRKFVANNAYLSAEMNEARERLKDRAEQVIREGLEDPDERYAMARYVMSGVGKDRGFGANSGKNLSVVSNGGSVIIQWADETPITRPVVIEGETVDG